MSGIKIKVTINNVHSIVAKAESFQSDIDLTYNHYIVDCKSFVAVTTMIGNKYCYVSINSNDEEEIKRFNEEMEEFKCD